MKIFTKEMLEKFLLRISDEECGQAKVDILQFSSAERFKVVAKCHLPEDQNTEYYSQFASEWVRRFASFTYTSWIVRHTFTKLKRLLYRKTYFCHRSGFNKCTDPDFNTRNQKCKAKIEFRMKFTNKNTIKNDPGLKHGLNLTISVDFIHTHTVHSPEAFRLLKSTPETDEAFQDYFDNGCTVMAAKRYHELALIDKYGAESRAVLSSATLNPTVHHINYIFTKKKKEYGGHQFSFEEIIPGKKTIMNAAGFDVDYIANSTYDDPRYSFQLATLVTPTMKRVLSQCNLDDIWMDYVFIPNGPSILMTYVPSVLGPLPVACVLSNKKDLHSSFSMTREIFEDACGKNLHQSKKIVSPDYKADVLARHHNPYSMTIKRKVSRNCLCSQIWSWLNDNDNKVDRKKRHTIMALITSMVYAQTLEDAEKIYTEIHGQKHAKLQKYIEELWEKRDEWLYLEEDKQLSNQLIEITIRATREFLMKKCQGFNICLMLDVVAKILEKHFRRLLLSVVKGTRVEPLLTKYLDQATIDMDFGSGIQQTSKHEFQLDLKQTPKKLVHFRTDTLCCDCDVGRKGDFCEHLAAIINLVSCEQVKLPQLSDEEKELFTNIAGGEEDLEEANPDVPTMTEDARNPDIEEDLEMPFESFELEPEPEPLKPPTPAPKRMRSLSPDEFSYFESAKFNPLDSDEEPREIDDYDYKYGIHIVRTPSPEYMAQFMADPVPSTSSQQGFEEKREYENALKEMNVEFRRLNKQFRDNPNRLNLDIMKQLVIQLKNISPVKTSDLKDLNNEENAAGEKPQEAKETTKKVANKSKKRRQPSNETNSKKKEEPVKETKKKRPRKK